MRKFLILLFLLISPLLSSQTILNIKGQTYINSETGTWNGVQVPKAVPTVFSFIDNSITSVNTGGFMLLAGDEVPTTTNNNLDGSIITGNKLTWNGNVDTGLHGLFVGYNKNDVVKYNYLDKVPYGIIFKSGISSGSNMNFTTGGFAYNIVRNSDIAVRIKGINGICVYNNTFFDNLHTNVPGIIYISSNPDNGALPSTGTKIKNNIFYTTNQITNIYIETGSEGGFESDYNIFYCESGTPLFSYQGQQKTFLQWQALGFDIHSRVINPLFTNINTLVPSARLDYGTVLGTVWEDGISIDAVWGTSDPSKAKQNGTWQVGARIYNAIIANPVYVSSAIENAAPDILEMTYNVTLANVIPGVSSFAVLVNSQIRPVSSVALKGNKVLLTLESRVVYNDVISVSYSKPASNPLQSSEGAPVESIVAKPVVNNCNNSSPVVLITSPADGSDYDVPANILITASASDSDGSISNLAFYNGLIKLGEVNSAPYSFSWANVSSGTYFITAIATDNSLAKTTSIPVKVNVSKKNDPVDELISLYPIPNDGNFTVDILEPLESEHNIISVINYAGKQVYNEILSKEQKSRHLNLSFIDPGIYILMIIGRDILITKKFIKN